MIGRGKLPTATKTIYRLYAPIRHYVHSYQDEVIQPNMGWTDPPTRLGFGVDVGGMLLLADISLNGGPEYGGHHLLQ